LWRRHGDSVHPEQPVRILQLEPGAPPADTRLHADQPGLLPAGLADLDPTRQTADRLHPAPPGAGPCDSHRHADAGNLSLLQVLRVQGAPHVKSDELSELYQIRFAEEELPRKNAIWREICQGFLNRFVQPGDTVVDVACGYGEFINNIQAREKIAVDLNPDARKFLQGEVEFHQCAATELGSVVRGRADAVFTSNFLEHLPDKPTLDLFLDQVMLALKPGGRYLILGPNLRYLPGEYWDFYD